MIRDGIQRFGRSLSAMVMPNIGAFIAWGLITALFIPGGWWPNEHMAKLVSPMLKYLLPTLIAYTAGKNVGGVRGGVAGAVATMGVIIGTDTPMFLGAMLMGPLAGWCIKRFDKWTEGKVGAGFEMLVDNFSLGIIAMLLAITGYLVIGGIVSGLTNALSSGVDWMLRHKMNPLLAVLVDPAKVLFLNNAVNHGIMTPLGIQQAAEAGKSMLFLIDPNPGPGLGILLSCWVFGKGMTKQSAPGAAVIQLFGGIHEIYFPYILMKPQLVLAVIAGGMSGVFTMWSLDGGLIAPSSPGSIIAILAMTPKGAFLANIADVIVATIVSFVVASALIKMSKDTDEEESLEDAQASMAAMKAASKGQAAEKKVSGKELNFIAYACDAGMGSSALGAAALRKKLHKDGYTNITVKNFAIGNIPKEAPRPSTSGSRISPTTMSMTSSRPVWKA